MHPDTIENKHRPLVRERLKEFWQRAEMRNRNMNANAVVLVDGHEYSLDGNEPPEEFLEEVMHKGYFQVQSLTTADGEYSGGQPTIEIECGKRTPISDEGCKLIAHPREVYMFIGKDVVKNDIASHITEVCRDSEYPTICRKVLRKKIMPTNKEEREAIQDYIEEDYTWFYDKVDW